MGWAIKRPDGTYRAWNSNTQDDALQPGEVWVPLDTPPTIPVPTPPPNPLKRSLETVLNSTELSPALRALLVTWNSQL